MTAFETTVTAMRAPGQFFAAAAPVFVSRAPGRLDLMGGNVDYTGGLVFQATIREATWAAAQLRDDSRIVLLNPEVAARGWHARVEFNFAEMTTEKAVRALVNLNPAIRWTAYVLGSFYLLRRLRPDRVTRGANVYIASDVPLNKGVSSSAAIEVAVMKALARAYGVELAGVELAEACQWCENVIAESACGVMDQAAIVLGDEGCVLPLLCQTCRPAPLVRLDDSIEYCAVDSGVSHAVTGIEYEAARAAAFVGYTMICRWEELPVALDESGRVPRFIDARYNGYLSNLPPSVFRSRYEQLLPERICGSVFLRDFQSHFDPYTQVRPEIQYRVRACTRYAVEENHRIQLFVELAAKRGSAIQMGELMYQSHYSYTECGLGCEATDLLVDLVRQRGPGRGLYGAKITGGGAGGTVAMLAQKGSSEALEEVIEAYASVRGGRPYVFTGSSMGADLFGVRTL